MPPSWSLREIPEMGFIKAATMLDDETSKVKAYRMGSIPYAQPLDPTQRWQRARPLPSAYRYGTESHPTDFTSLSNECPQAESDLTRMHEDCLQLSIWTPPRAPPPEGWPVLFYIRASLGPLYGTAPVPTDGSYDPADGGYLQFGSPNSSDPSALIAELGLDIVFVAPTYRLHALGFLASAELAVGGNLGFWDQRLALDWVRERIRGFGGDPQRITIAGLSAGAYSCFHQLAYEVGLPDNEACIRQVVMWSNGCGLPPKPVDEVRAHVDALLAALHVPATLGAAAKMAALRARPWPELVRAVERLTENAFRAVTDGAFVRASLFAELRDGRFGATLRRRGVRLAIGEVRDEVTEYRERSPPSSYGGLVRRLAVEYPEEAAERLGRIYGPTGGLPAGFPTWQDLFGKVYADMQVYVSERGLLASVTPALPLSNIARYRIEWRAKCVDEIAGPEKGVTHGSDLVIWLFGNALKLSPKERELAQAFLEPWARFLKGHEFDWGTKSIAELRTVTSDGSVGVESDARWEECLGIWDSLFQETNSSF